MLAQLDWMTPASKLESYKKIDNLITNIAWPELVENDQKLTEFHANLDIKETMSYTEMVTSKNK
jgi:predicted metalloendopeptidase